MIVFRHQVTNFGNIQMVCEGHAGQRGESLPCAAASALMAAIVGALQRIETPTLRLETTAREGHVSVRCKLTPETAAMARVTIAGFTWLAEQAPEDVRCEPMKK